MIRITTRSVSFFTHSAQYVVFDLLYFRGRSLLDQPLSERRRLLYEELPELPFVTLCEGIVGDGKAYFREAVAQGYEGVVAKRLTSRYTPNRRGTAWRKIKETMELPCAVIGYRSGAIDGHERERRRFRAQAKTTESRRRKVTVEAPLE